MITLFYDYINSLFDNLVFFYLFLVFQSIVFSLSFLLAYFVVFSSAISKDFTRQIFLRFDISNTRNIYFLTPVLNKSANP